MLCFVSVACLPKIKGRHTVCPKKRSCFFYCWRFLEHETSDCHKDYKKLLDIADDEVDVGEQMSDSLVNEKAKN